MDGNVLARRIVCIAVREKATNSSKGFFFFSELVIDLAVCCAICGDRVQSGLCLPSRVQLSNNGLGSTFKAFLESARVRVPQIKYWSGSVPCNTFTGLFGFVYEFLDP